VVESLHEAVVALRAHAGEGVVYLFELLPRVLELGVRFLQPLLNVLEPTGGLRQFNALMRIHRYTQIA
jgi:hypothetical protein